MSETLETRVRDAVALCFGLETEDVLRSTARQDVEAWDSVGHLNLMLLLEEQFDVRLEIEDMEKLVSVDAILRFLERSCPST